MKSAMKKRYITHWHRRRLARFHRDYNDVSKFMRESSARLFLEPAVPPIEYFVNCPLRNLSICFLPLLVLYEVKMNILNLRGQHFCPAIRLSVCDLISTTKPFVGFLLSSE